MFVHMNDNFFSDDWPPTETPAPIRPCKNRKYQNRPGRQCVPTFQQLSREFTRCWQYLLQHVEMTLSTLMCISDTAARWLSLGTCST